MTLWRVWCSYLPGVVNVLRSIQSLSLGIGSKIFSVELLVLFFKYLVKLNNVHLTTQTLKLLFECDTVHNILLTRLVIG